MANLPTDRNVIIVIDNAKYYNQLFEGKIHSMKFKEGDMLTFMSKRNITVPLPVPTKPVWIQKKKDHNIQS